MSGEKSENVENVKVEEKELKKDNKDVNKEEKVKTKKSHKKPVIITIIVLLILIALAVGGYFVYQQIELNKPLETAWGDTYYAYLKEVQKEPAKLGFSLDGESQDMKLQFYQVEENTDPVMGISYTGSNNSYSNSYYIKDGEVNFLGFTNVDGIELLYNIEEEKYGWYVHTKYEGKETYRLLENFDDDGSTSKYYNMEENEEATVETVDGETLSISKFDETFIKPEVNESVEINFNLNMTEKELKDAVEEAIEGYKEQEEIITEDVKNQITQKQEELENKEQEMEDAKEAVEKKEEEEVAKKAAEEAAKKAEEEASKVIQAGKYTLKYGKYTGTDYAVTDDRNSKMEVTIILNSNGTYTRTNKIVSTGEYESNSGTFKVQSNGGYGSSYGDMMLSLSSDGMYIVSGNNQFSLAAGSGATFKYQGN